MVRAEEEQIKYEDFRLNFVGFLSVMIFSLIIAVASWTIGSYEASTCPTWDAPIAIQFFGTIIPAIMILVSLGKFIADEQAD